MWTVRDVAAYGRRRGPSPALGASACIGLLLLAGAAMAKEPDLSVSALAELSLEELINIDVTTVSRRTERLAGVPASVFVITAEDIRRSGYRTLPEVLRLAPNLQVARSGASGYAISARGFNNDNGLANKLLVLIDGRTVYSLSLSGVFWDMQDVMLEDVERIEVISGAGATLWGTNAVNGVINVITRRSSDTRGPLVSLEGGNRRSGGAARYGARLGDNGSIRLYGKADDLRRTEQADGTGLDDGWRRGQAGFRADWGDTEHGFTLQGDTYRGKSDERPVFDAVKVSGSNLLARWNTRLDGGSDLQVQSYFDHSSREDRLLFWDEIDVFDVEFQHGIPLGAHHVLWGADYRHASDNSHDSLFFGFVPRKLELEWLSLFVQDQIKLGRDLDLTLGTRAERNDYTGWEYLPSARLGWAVSDSHLLWGAVSRAVRAPARLDRELHFPPNGLFINGGPDFVSEIADVIEIGYRGQPTSDLTYSFTLFHDIYDKLRSGQPAPGAQVQNKIQGTTDGIEGWASYQVAAWWRLSAGFSTLHKDLDLEADSTDPTGPSALGNDPEQQWIVRSSFNPAERHEFDLTVRHVGSLPQPAVPGYTAVDARWGWMLPGRKAEISLTLQNLFDPRHAEFGDAATRSEYERAVSLNLLWTI
jgi:iron complex outermembrane receptor protein